MFASKYADHSPNVAFGSASSTNESKPLPSLPDHGNLNASKHAASESSTHHSKRTSASASSAHAKKASKPSFEPPAASVTGTNADISLTENQHRPEARNTRQETAIENINPRTAAGNSLGASLTQTPDTKQDSARLFEKSLNTPNSLSVPGNLTRTVSSPMSAAGSPAKKLLSKKGKPVVIRIPSEHPDDPNARRPLSKNEYEERFDHFTSLEIPAPDFAQGVNTDRVPFPEGHAQNRAMWPDPAEDLREKRPGFINVAIPDKSKWDEYINELTEAKLRALGVSSGAEDEETTGMSSRSESTPFQVLPAAASPPVRTSSAASQNRWQNAQPFTSPFLPASLANNNSSVFSSPGTPVNNQPRPGHFSRQSIFGFSSSAAAQGGYISPQSFPSQHNILPSVFRAGSPAFSGALQRMPSSLSRQSPDLFNDHHPAPRTISFGPKPSGRGTLITEEHAHGAVGGEAGTLGAENFERPSPPDSQHRDNAYAELAYPAPQGHRHNISANLEREAENAQYYPGEYVQGSIDRSEDLQQPPAAGSGPLGAKQKGPEPQQNCRHRSVPSNVSAASSSRLNVDAKEFTFSGNSSHANSEPAAKNPFMPATIGASNPNPSSKPAVSMVTAHANGESTGGVNFTPSAPALATPAQQNFDFPSSGFDFAPERSDPSAITDSRASDYQEHKHADKGSRIFNFPDIIKPGKRSKAIPIVNPNTLPKKAAEEEEHEDEFGRITQGIGRYKRGRLAPAEHDEVPKFGIPGDNVESASLDRVMKKSTSQPPSTERNEHRPGEEAGTGEAPEPWHDLSDIERPAARAVEPASQDMDTEAKHTSNASLDKPESVPKPSQSLLLEAASPLLLTGNRPSEQSPGNLASPTFQEIDAVMEDLNRSDPNLGMQSTQAMEEYIDRPSSGIQESKAASDKLVFPIESQKMSRNLLEFEQPHRPTESPVHKLNKMSQAQISDWDDVLSPGEEHKFLPRAPFFDTRMKGLLDSIMQQQMEPFLKSVKDIDASVKAFASKESHAQSTAASREKTSSDADDEDEPDRSGKVRPRGKVEQRLSQIRSVVLDALASSNAAGKSDRLESEIATRHEAEKRASDLQRMLDLSEKEIALFKEASENQEESMQALKRERHSSQQRVSNLEKFERELRAKNSGLAAEVNALQSTLEEYRISSTKWREEIQSVKAAREALHDIIDRLKKEAEGHSQSREWLENRIANLQQALDDTKEERAAERLTWQKRGEEQVKDINLLRLRLDEETRLKKRLDAEIERLSETERGAIKATVTLDEVRNGNIRLTNEVARLREECMTYQNEAALHEREALETKDIARAEIQRNKTLLEAEIEIANRKAESVRTDLETRLDMTKGDLERSRASAFRAQDDFRKMTEENNLSRTAALREAADISNARLAEERRRLENMMNDLSKQHNFALRNALDEKQQTESHLGQNLQLSSDKVAHLQNMVQHLEDKVTVAQSAAQAAAVAAQNVKSTPAQSSNLPKPSERVSPQALRESIAVLQEQLQERESRIEKLKQDNSRLDKDAPEKIKERDTEISWLRELLGVRVDDLSELVSLLSRDSFDRIAARDAAIRIRANLQMEQQEKERVFKGKSVTGAPVPTTAQLPSLSDIQNFASPKAAQLAAAWGNWRNGRNSSLAGLRDVANSSGITTDQTPSKLASSSAPIERTLSSSSNAAQAFLSGLMTPPASNLRRTPTPHNKQQIEDDQGSAVSADEDAVPLSLQLPDDYDDGDGAESSHSSALGGSPSRPRSSHAPYLNGSAAAPITPPRRRPASCEQLKDAHSLGPEGLSRSNEQHASPGENAESPEQSFGDALKPKQ